MLNRKKPLEKKLELKMNYAICIFKKVILGFYLDVFF